MAARTWKILMEWDEESRVWVTYVPELGNISTYADTQDEARKATRELILGYLEAAKEDDAPPSQLTVIELTV